MKQDVRIVLNYKYGKKFPLYKVPCNKKGNIVNRNMDKNFDNDVFAYEDEHEDNNVPNYDMFNKHVFDIYQQVEKIEFAYLIVVSKWVTLDLQYPTIDEFLKWRKKWFQNECLENPLKITMKTIFLIVIKKEEEILMMAIHLFVIPKKLKID